MEKRGDMQLAEGVTPPHAQKMSAKTVDYYWKMFHEAREQSRGEHNES